ncbi:MAG: hypothetical protein JXB38_02670 [Anaerolineales bacterium]|nr:hypothetical protein [Anaerolineales bacterium]
MKRLSDLEELVFLGHELDCGQSAPCVLEAPELLAFATRHLDFQITTAQVAEDATTFLPEPQHHQQAPLGVFRHEGSNSYPPITLGRIAAGVTRISQGDFAQLTATLEADNFGPVQVSQYADGDLLRFYLHRSPCGPVVLLEVLTQSLVADLVPPRIALNPFGTTGFNDYLLCIFETGGFFWALTEGQRAVILSTIRPYYAPLVQAVHQASAQATVAHRDFRKALTYVRKSLQDNN